MSALAIEDHAISILKLYIVVIENFTILLSLSHFTATHALCFHRIAALEPIDNVKVVDMLLYNVITANPIKIIPIAHLVFHFSLTRFPWVHPHSTVIPPCLCRDEVANRSFIESFIELAIRVLI